MGTRGKFILPIAIISVAAVGWYGLRQLRCMDRLGSFYPTQAHAVAAGAVDKGWLPKTLPIEAIDIHEEHDLDTNEVWMRFTIGPEGALQFVNSLRHLSPREVASLTIRSPCDRRWWFDGLIEQQPANDGALNAEVYAGRLVDMSSHVVVAIDRASPTVFYWSFDFKPVPPANGTEGGS